MRIAFIEFSKFPDGGAVAHRTFMMAKGLALAGHHVSYLVARKYHNGWMTKRIEGVNVIWAGLGHEGKANYYLAKMENRINLVKALNRLAREGLDWLFLYQPGLDALPYIYLSNKYGFRIALESNELRLVEKGKSLKANLFNVLHKISIRIILSQVDVNIVCSRIIESLIKSKTHSKPVLIVPAVVDIDKYKYDATSGNKFRTKYNLGDNLIISYLGGYHYVRGPHILLQAGRILVDSGAEFTLVMGGKVENLVDYVNVPKIVDDLKMDNVIILNEWLGERDLIAAYSAADILVVPNLGLPEGQASFPHKIAEILSMGKPLVASAVGDIPLYLHDGVNALLFKPGDAASLAEALSRLISSPDLRLRLSQQARQTAVEVFDCRIIAGQLESKFSEIMK